MKNSLKRVLSFVLVMMLLISCVPAVALAAENTGAAQNITTGVEYASLAEAMAAAAAGQTVKALADCDEAVTYTDGVILDLNGHHLTNVTVPAGVTLTAIDSATDDYEGEYGSLTTDGTVAATVTTAEPKSYVSVCENGNWSFHRYYAAITAISLKPASAALGYKAEFYGDEVVKNAVVNYGYEMSLNDYAPKALTKTDKLEKNVLTLRLNNILKEGNDTLNAIGSTASIHGKAFITLNLNGEEVTLSSAQQTTTLRATIEAINANVAAYSEAALQSVRNLCTTYAAWMAGWATENIFGISAGEGDLDVEVIVPVTAENNMVTEAAVLSYQNIVATVPAGTVLADGTTELKLTITDKASSDSNVTENEGETLRPLDVHIEGISEDNTAPIVICLGSVLPKGLNIGNYELYHVEDGQTVVMTLVNSVSELDAHNEFCYDPATGAVTVAVCSFSEIMLTNTAAYWTGGSAAPVEKDGVYYIYNADQLRGFAEMVGGMNGYTANDFAGKTVVLQADMNLNDTDSENGRVFYPIGYYNSTYSYTKTAGGSISSGFKPFKGTFDGNGHTVSNFYQNTWEMFGDYNDGYSGTPNHYRDGMGLFGKVYGGTVKNLTVKDFSSDGEFTTTGAIAAYADNGATFENISIFDCNPRVYNIGNGGIVGCVGWYNSEVTDSTPVTFRNITVDNTNKISALWGSWDVACGGLVGQYYPTSGQESATDNAGIYMENCHVTAQIDVNNDVCANYQYYAYRYAGILIGSVRENETIDGHVYPKMDDITAKDCTVGFGDWNDYYYCELVANSIASYTHDYQFSRLTQVKAVNGTTITYMDDTTGTVPDSGRYNYVVVNGGHATENATCYHFVDGDVWNHADAGYEDLDGDGTEETLIENNQHIYLEFNNLITGYGWGVTSKGVDDMNGVTILDKSAAEKFTYIGGSNLITDKTFTIGSLFQVVADATLDADNVQVFVSPADENSTVSGVYNADPTNWQNGTLTLNGIGMAKITITDYYYCTATTALVIMREEPYSSLNLDMQIDTLGGNWGELIEVRFYNYNFEGNPYDAYTDRVFFKAGQKQAVELDATKYLINGELTGIGIGIFGGPEWDTEISNGVYDRHTVTISNVKVEGEPNGCYDLSQSIVTSGTNGTGYTHGNGSGAAVCGESIVISNGFRYDVHKISLVEEAKTYITMDLEIKTKTSSYENIDIRFYPYDFEGNPHLTPETNPNNEPMYTDLIPFQDGVKQTIKLDAEEYLIDGELPGIGIGIFGGPEWNTAISDGVYDRHTITISNVKLEGAQYKVFDLNKTTMKSGTNGTGFTNANSGGTGSSENGVYTITDGFQYDCHKIALVEDSNTYIEMDMLVTTLSNSTDPIELRFCNYGQTDSVHSAYTNSLSVIPGTIVSVRFKVDDYLVNGWLPGFGLAIFGGPEWDTTLEDGTNDKHSVVISNLRLTGAYAQDIDLSIATVTTGLPGSNGGGQIAIVDGNIVITGGIRYDGHLITF